MPFDTFQNNVWTILTTLLGIVGALSQHTAARQSGGVKLTKVLGSSAQSSARS